MRGLFGLCRSKGDKSDDTQDTPARPVQQAPRKGDQTVSANLRTNTSSRDSNANKPARRDLWKEAFDGLNASHQKYLPANSLPATDAIFGVIHDTTAKYEEWKKGGLKVHRKNEDDINIRDSVERIIGAAMKAQEVISKLVSFDPTGHASTAWTVISLGMSTVQNRLDRRDAIFSAAEYLAETLAYYALVDEKYRNQDVGSDTNLDKALLDVYSAILEYTAQVKKDQEENAAARVWHSILPLVDQPLGELKSSVEAQNATVTKWLGLSINLGDRKRAEAHLKKTDETIQIARGIESKVITAEEESQLVWMSTADYSSRQIMLQKKRTNETGSWLLNLEEYNVWKYNAGDILWLSGISGCGKSVLCSTIVHDLEELCRLDPSKSLAYWYFEFGVEATKSVDLLIRSLIRQLSRSPLLSSVTNLWNEHHLRGSQPDSEAILTVLDAVLASISGQVYLVFDALDECPLTASSKERESLLSLLVGRLHRHKDKVHILALSRSEADIRQELKKFSNLDIEAYLAEDVEAFVAASLSQSRLNRLSKDVQNLITDTLLSFKERRFRWAELQMIELEKCYNEHEIRQALKEIPESLEKTYNKVLDSIVLKDVPRARGILMMICLSPVALDLKTVAEMFDLEHCEDIIKICTTSLVREFDDKIQVAHFSVQEFLTVSEGTQHHKCQFSVTDGHRCLAEMTVDKLLAQTEVLTRSDAMKRLSFLYAAKNWYTHLAAAGCIDSLCSSLQCRVDRLFTEPIIYVNWVNATRSNSEWRTEWGQPVKLASAMGLIHTVDYLITNGADPFQRDRLFAPGDSLSVAAQNGHLDVLQFLLNKVLPLTKSMAESTSATAMTLSIVNGIHYRKADKAKLGIILQTLRDHGLLTKQSTDLSETLMESVLSSAMGNPSSGVEIMSVFLDWRPEISVSITDGMLKLAFRYLHTSAPLLLKLLLERYYDHVPPAIIKRLESDDTDYCATKCLLHVAIERPNQLPITDDILGRFAFLLDSAMVLQLVRSRSKEIRVTQHVLENAAANSRGADMLPLMWPYGEPGLEVSKDMLVRAISSDNVGFLLQKLGPTWTLDQPTILEIIQVSKDGAAILKVFLGLPALNLSVSEGLIESICCNRDAVEMLELVAKDGSLGVPITENAVHAAVLNWRAAASVINCLAQLSQDPLPVTERAIIGAVENPWRGDTVLKVLMRNSPDHMFTDRVFEKACCNKAAMMLLLDQTKKEPPLEKILSQISRCECARGKHAVEVLQVLVERHLVSVDQHLFETLVTNCDAVEFLLSLKQDVQITEGTLIAAIRGGECQGVLGIIHEEQGLISFTEKVTRAAFTIRPDPDFIRWLVGLQPELFVRDFFERTWTDDLDVDVRIGILLAFIDKTGSGITDIMLQDYPYDPDSPNNYQLEDFIRVLWYGDDLPDLPATERGTEIILERCDIDVIEIFLLYKGGLVTERVIQGAERNRIADKKEVMRLLREIPRLRGETMTLEVMAALDKIVE